MYADLTRNCKKYGIKSLYDNRCDVEHGTGKYAINGDGRQTPWVYQDAKGDWHYTEGQQPQQFMKLGLEDSDADILKIINNEIRRQLGDA